jgi:hypothetical protein
MKNKIFINGEIWKSNSCTKITDKKNVEIIDTKEKPCCNCKGFGDECDKGFAWIYCDIRAYFEFKFNGDSGECVGCSEFIYKCL